MTFLVNDSPLAGTEGDKVTSRVIRERLLREAAGNVALRVPDAAIPRAVVDAFGLPITATSANLAGLPECTSAGCVRDQIGDRIPLIVDGGPSGRGLHTTIVDLSGGESAWQVLREGSIPTHEIALVLQQS